MAEGKKISELTELTTGLSDNDEFVVVNKDVQSGANAGVGGQTTRITFGELKESVGTQGPKGATGEKGEPGDSAFTVNSGKVSLGDVQVGIGTDDPSAKLEIKTSTIWGNYNNEALAISNSGSSGNIKEQHGLGRIKWVTDVDATAASIDAIRTRPEQGNNTDLIFSTNTGGSSKTEAERMRITSKGRIGIGTNDPLAMLHIKMDESTDGLRLTQSKSGSAGDWRIGPGVGSTPDGAFGFFDDNIYKKTASNIPLATRMVITSEGRVGIGTSSPANNLVITGSSNSGSTLSDDPPYMVIENSFNEYSKDYIFGGLAFTKTGSRNVNGSLSSGVRAGIVAFYDEDHDFSKTQVNSNVGLGLYFRTSAQNVGDGQTSMTITGSGNVGIGTHKPLGKLHVLGNTAIEAGRLDFYPNDDTGTYVEIVNRGKMLNNKTEGAGNAKGFKFWTDSGAGAPDVKIEPNKLTVDGTIEATNFTLGGKAFSSTDLRGPTGATGPAGPAGTNGNDGEDAMSNRHLQLKTDGPLNLLKSSPLGHSVSKTGSNGAWNAQLRSGVKYTGAQTLSFASNYNNKYFMMGLGASEANSSYTDIDYAFYARNGAVEIREKGAKIGDFGTYVAGTDFTIVYDNDKIKYYVGGNWKRTVQVGAGKSFYIDSSFYHTANNILKYLHYSPMGPVGPQGERGVKGDTGAKGAKGDTGSVGPKGEQGSTGPAGNPISVAEPFNRWDASNYSTGAILYPLKGSAQLNVVGNVITTDDERGKVFNWPANPGGQNKSNLWSPDIWDAEMRDGTFTWSAWIKPRGRFATTPDTKGHGAIVTKWTTAMANGGNNSFICYQNGSFVSSYSYSTTPTGNWQPELNKWTHLTWTLKNGVCTLYANGKMIPTSSQPRKGGGYPQHTKHTFKDSTQRIRIGAIATQGYYQFNGCIDDVKFYDTHLSEGEVYFAYNGIGGGGLVGPSGPAGAKGATGPKGDKGDKGAKGDTGSRGQQGNVGPIGPKGAKGDKGDKGADGTSAVVNYASNKRWDVATGKAYFNAENAGNFNVNGTSAENSVAWEIGPFGRRTKVWKARNNDTASNADGGWNKAITGLKKNAGYMSVVYVRRVSDNTSGTYYHGCGQGTDTLNLDNSTAANPYFGYFNISLLPKDVWCLSVGYIHANNDTSKTHHGGGLYRIDTGARIDIPKFWGDGSGGYKDYKMATSGIQNLRTYLYYSTSPSASLDWTLPGFYEVTSDSPTLGELLGGAGVGGGKEGPKGATGATGPRGPAGPQPSVTEIQNTTFTNLKSKGLTMSGTINLGVNALNWSSGNIFNLSNNSFYQSQSGKHYFQTLSNSGGEIICNKITTNEISNSAVSFKGESSHFNGGVKFTNGSEIGFTDGSFKGIKQKGHGIRLVSPSGNNVYDIASTEAHGQPMRLSIDCPKGVNKSITHATILLSKSLQIDVGNREEGPGTANTNDWMFHGQSGRHYVDSIKSTGGNMVGNEYQKRNLEIESLYGDILIKPTSMGHGPTMQAKFGRKWKTNHHIQNGRVYIDAYSEFGSNIAGGMFLWSSHMINTKKMRLEIGAGYIIPVDLEGGGANLGSWAKEEYRFDNIYLKNAPNTGSDRRMKVQIKKSDLGLDFIRSLKPVSYKLKDTENDTHNRTHYGLIAQDVQKTLDGKDFAGFVDPNVGMEEEEGVNAEDVGKRMMSLRYEEFISPMIKAIKEMDNKITYLEKGKKVQGKRITDVGSKLEKKHDIVRNRMKNMEKGLDDVDVSDEDINEKLLEHSERHEKKLKELEEKHEKRIKEMDEKLVETKEEMSREFPEHWGDRPVIETKDYVKLPEGYGYGSSTLKNWILENLRNDREGVGELKATQLRILDSLDKITQRLDKLEEGDDTSEGYGVDIQKI